MQPSIANIDDVTINRYYNTAVREYTSVFPVDINPSVALSKNGFATWLSEERKAKMPRDYISRYLIHLRNEGRSDKVIAEIARSSESILGKLGDPQSNSAFYVKGLVVGSVQSGKTGNFNAVINRAVDAGYNLVIILSGIMEDLRSQTQLRLELDVIGEGLINPQTDQQGVKGVGKINRFGVQGNSEIPQVFSITSHKSDFKKQVQDANFSLNHKNLLVCKKNTGVLKNLLVWLSDYLQENTDQHAIPLLIIDDEADNASLNNLGHKGRNYASIINGHIRAILALFSKKTYLGYTATPFANVLQDRNEEAEGLWPISYKRNGEVVTKNFYQVSNIFPDDFIELLEQPSNYIGARQIFETVYDSRVKKIPLVEAIADTNIAFPSRLIDDTEGVRPATATEIEEEDLRIRSPKKDDLFPTILPESLKEAIECFILSIAVRLKRRPNMVGSKLYNPHNTMLIHVSRFTDWQNRTRSLVQQEVSQTIDKITAELPSSPKSIYAKLEKTWNKYYAAIVANIRTYLPEAYSDEFLDTVCFNDIKALLPEAVKGLDVKAINSVTKDKLIYSVDSSGNGKKYIAIGGNRLSRGFTLEGLSINYFIRDTNYADTLLQMGRWFGYRPGYIDCCKLFTTWDSIEKFNAATRTIEELELEFKKMERVGKTPEDFVLRVRTHPGVLQITRPSILKNTEEVNWSYHDTLVQTTQFILEADYIEKAWKSLKEKIQNNNWVKVPHDDSFYVLEDDADVQKIFEFLDSENSFYRFQSELNQMKAFIRIAVNTGRLTKWRIGIKTKGRGQMLTSEKTGLPSDIHLSMRSAPTSGIYRRKLVEDGVFTGSGQSANIVTSGSDLSLWLSEAQIAEAQKAFIEEKTKELIELKKMHPEDAGLKATTFTYPERIYREKMNEENGILLIYLMDMKYVLPDEDLELKEVKQSRGIDDSIPLIGYAIGFPRIEANIGGTYVKGRFDIEADEPPIFEFDDEALLMSEEVL